MDREVERILPTIDNTPLDLNDDCVDVVDALETLATRWKEVGFKLRLRPDKLEEIEHNYSRNISHCLHEVIVEWLRQNYNTERFGEPTWRSLAEAVWKLNKQVFRTIAKDHNTGVEVAELLCEPAQDHEATHQRTDRTSVDGGDTENNSVNDRAQLKVNVEKNNRDAVTSSETDNITVEHDEVRERLDSVQSKFHPALWGYIKAQRQSGESSSPKQSTTPSRTHSNTSKMEPTTESVPLQPVSQAMVTDEGVGMENQKSSKNGNGTTSQNGNGTSNTTETKNKQHTTKSVVPKYKPHTGPLLEYKIVVIGSGGVGKSGIVVRFVQNVFVQKYDPTIEDSYRKQCSLDNTDVMLDILDTAGVEQFSSMRDLYMKNGQGFLLVYSVTNRITFEEIPQLYEHLISVKQTLNKSIKVQVAVVLVANKIDLIDERVVSTEEGEQLANKLKVPFVETSAVTGQNVTEAFAAVVREVRSTLAANNSSSETCCSIL